VTCIARRQDAGSGVLGGSSCLDQACWAPSRRSRHPHRRRFCPSGDWRISGFPG